MPEVPVNPAQPAQVITVEELYRQKGELVTQLEIVQQRLQIINQQLNQVFSQQRNPQ